MESTYLCLSDQDRKAFAQVEWLLETSTGLALRRGVATIHIAVVIAADALGALLLGSSLLLDGARLVATARSAASSHAVFLSLQLGR